MREQAERLKSNRVCERVTIPESSNKGKRAKDIESEEMQRTKIEWVKNPDGSRGYTWNPVTGCLHNCSYCYDFHLERLIEPQKIKKPSTIFVCNMADLFGSWVPEEWIEKVIEACQPCRQHTFLFCTKNPKRYLGRHFWPAKYLLGTSCEGGNIPSFGIPTKQMYISFEPLIKPPNLCDLNLLHLSYGWVVIGAQTGPGAIRPERSWIEAIVENCKKYKIPLFLKNNLDWPEKIQQIPWIEG